MKTSYHDESMRLLRCAEDLSGLQDVLDFECRHRLQLPGAVREFYANPRLTSLLDNKGGDRLVLLSDLNIAEVETTRRLLFMVENQGVFLWATDLSGSEDPPVIVRENEEGKPWIACCDRFSTYVYTRVFENQFLSGAKHGVNCELECFPKLSPAELELLRSRFREEPTTFGLATIIYRFSNGSKQLATIYNADYGATIFIYAVDQANFEELKAVFRPQWKFPN